MRTRAKEKGREGEEETGNTEKGNEENSTTRRRATGRRQTGEGRKVEGRSPPFSLSLSLSLSVCVCVSLSVNRRKVRRLPGTCIPAADPTRPHWGVSFFGPRRRHWRCPPPHSAPAPMLPPSHRPDTFQARYHPLSCTSIFQTHIICSARSHSRRHHWRCPLPHSAPAPGLPPLHSTGTPFKPHYHFLSHIFTASITFPCITISNTLVVTLIRIPFSPSIPSFTGVPLYSYACLQVRYRDC
jgi:hypothetical protein